MKRIALCLCLLVVAMAPQSQAGDYAVPDWTLEDVAGNAVSLHDQLDRGPVLISFWALPGVPWL